MRRAGLAAAGVVLSLTCARNAYSTPSAKLVYVRGAGTTACPDESELRRAVATRIGYDPFFPSATKTVIAQVSRAPKGYRGRVQIVGDDGNIRGERELATRGDDCSELISAMALAVSIALDDLDDGKPAPAAESVVDPVQNTSVAVVPPQAPPRDPEAEPALATLAPTEPARGLSVAASFGPVVSLGAAPAPSIGAGVAATLRYRWFAARAGLRADLPASGDLPGGGRLSTRAVLANASLCVRGDIPFFCAGGAVGSYATSTEAIPQPASDSALLVMILATGGVDVALSRQLYVDPFVEGGPILTRHRIVVDGAEAYRLPGFAGTVGIHLGWRFL